ncbi:hypothetical protein MCEREM30_03408 [Paracoccaceae bacterium]
MSLLDKLNFQTVSRQIERDPVAERRARFRAGIAEQRLVLAALARGEAYTDQNRFSKTGKARAVRAWFFQKGTGWFIQARYGARVLLLDGRSNAISVSKIAEIEPVLKALETAAEAGELDAVLAAAARRGKPEASK